MGLIDGRTVPFQGIVAYLAEKNYFCCAKARARTQAFVSSWKAWVVMSRPSADAFQMSSREDDLHLDKVTDSFNAVGDVVEWRMTGKRVIALILRFVVYEADEPNRPHHT